MCETLTHTVDMHAEELNEADPLLCLLEILIFISKSQSLLSLSNIVVCYQKALCLSVNDNGILPACVCFCLFARAK